MNSFEVEARCDVVEIGEQYPGLVISGSKGHSPVPWVVVQTSPVTAASNRTTLR
jgi:hypothetical protein